MPALRPDPKKPFECRPEVAALAQAMEQKLAANTHKTAWEKGADLGYFLRRLQEETEELQEAVSKHDEMPGSRERSHAVLLEAADVANFAMMIADTVHRRYCISDD